MNQCIRVYCDEQQIDANKNKLTVAGKSINLLAKAFGLAGNEVRLKIMFLISEDGQLCVCDLSDVLGMTMPAVSQHLKKMKLGKILKSKKVGQTIFYSLTPEYQALFDPFFAMIKSNQEMLPI